MPTNPKRFFKKKETEAESNRGPAYQCLGHTASLAKPADTTLIGWLNLFNAEPSSKRYWRGPRSQVGERGRLYLTQQCHRQNDSCIKMSSDESYFNISLTEGQSHKTESTDHNFCRERTAEAESNRGSQRFTSLIMPYRWTNPAHNSTGRNLPAS